MTLNIGVFGAFVLVVAVLGFFLWQTLFVFENYNYRTEKAEPTYSQQQSSGENTSGTSASPSGSKKTDEAIAEYTKWLAIFTLFLVLATIGLFISGERNLEVARKSTLAAKDSADAAKKSAEIAEQALIAGQRAFISVMPQYAADKDIKTEKIGRWTFTPIWKNDGATPTRDMENHINLRLSEKELLPDWDFPDIWPQNTAPDKRIAIPLGASPHSSVNGHAVSATVEAIDEVIAGKKFLYMWGWAAYNDVFPRTKRHITRFAFQIIIGGDPRTTDRISFTFSFMPKYNCSDEECDHQGHPVTWKARAETE